jgi:hypothetical protein
MAERSTLATGDGLVDLLDMLLGTGVVAAGDATLSVAGVDLVYLNLRALLASVESAWGQGRRSDAGQIPRGPPLPPRPPGGPRTPLGSEPVPPTTPPAGLDALERFAGTLDRAVPPLVRRFDADPEQVERGLAKLVLTVIDLLRRLMERQAVRRMEGGSLTADEIDRVGTTFLLLERRMEELQRAFGLDDQDLRFDLGLDIDDLA